MPLTGTPTPISYDFGILPGETISVTLNQDGTFTISRVADDGGLVEWGHVGGTFGVFRYNDD